MSCMATANALVACRQALQPLQLLACQSWQSSVRTAFSLAGFEKGTAQHGSAGAVVEQADGPAPETRHAWTPGAASAAPKASFAASGEERQATAAADGHYPPSSASSPSSSSSSSRQGDAPAATAKEAIVRDVCDVLRALKLHPGRDCVVGDDLCTLDVGVVVNGVQVAVEVEDEATEVFAATNARAYAMARMHDRMLQAHGWQPAKVSAAAWRRLGGQHEKLHFTVDLLNGVLRQQAGGQHGQHTHSHQGGCCGGGGGGGAQHQHPHTHDHGGHGAHSHGPLEEQQQQQHGAGGAHGVGHTHSGGCCGGGKH